MIRDKFPKTAGIGTSGFWELHNTTELSQLLFAIFNIFRYIGLHKHEGTVMYTTTDEHGILNNFAKEPKTYLADKPSPAKQRLYWLQGSAALLLIGGLLAITAAVS